MSRSPLGSFPVLAEMAAIIAAPALAGLPDITMMGEETSARKHQLARREKVLRQAAEDAAALYNFTMGEV